MATWPDYDRAEYDRAFFDYAFNREAAAQIRARMINGLIGKGLSIVKPSRRTLRNVGFAVLIATGAFWGVMLNDPPKTVAADPSTSAKAFSPLDLKVPVDLPTGDYIAN